MKENNDGSTEIMDAGCVIHKDHKLTYPQEKHMLKLCFMRSKWGINIEDQILLTLLGR